MMRIATTLAAGLLLPCLAAAEGPGRMDAAWLEAYEMQGEVFTEEQRAELAILAWHAMAANLCDGLTLDHAKFGTALGMLQHSDGATMDDDEHRYYEHHVAVNFGVTVGILLAEHAGPEAEVAAYCAEIAAEVAAAEDPMAHYFDTGDAGAGE